MRTAYALIGIGWLLIVIAGAYGFNHNFTLPKYTGTQKIIRSSNLDPMTSSSLSLISSAFEENEKIPAQFTCDGAQISPPLSISGVPEGAESLALIVDDPDVPKALKPDGVFDHWILFNIPPDTKEIPQGGSAGIMGANGAGAAAYTGPCPPAQYEPSEHRYVFTLYALDSELALGAGASKKDVLAAMEGHVIGEVQLLGRYKRQ